MIFYILGLFLNLSTAHAADNDRLCYDIYGNRDYCQRNGPRRETLVAGQFNSYYGDRTNSMVGSFGQGALISTVKSKGSVRFLFGGQLLYSTANTYVDDTAYGTTMMSADLIFGVSIKPYNDTYIKPVFELDLVGGMKSIEFTRVPAGAERKNLKPSYGGKVLVGIDVPLSKTMSLRPALDYQVTRMDDILPNDSLVLDALGVSLGLVFH